jgi:hypothetical protein
MTFFFTSQNQCHLGFGIVQLGLTRVFLKQVHVNELEVKREESMKKYALLLQVRSLFYSSTHTFTCLYRPPIPSQFHLRLPCLRCQSQILLFFCFVYFSHSQKLARRRHTIRSCQQCKEVFGRVKVMLSSNQREYNTVKQLCAESDQVGLDNWATKKLKNLVRDIDEFLKK